jgi:putative phage-type endonuclease
MSIAIESQPIVGPMPDTPEWLAAREGTITASDLPAILGRSEYKTAQAVFLEKTGQLPPFEGNEFTRRGKRWERPILGDYVESRNCCAVYPMPLFFSPSLPCLGATPDAACLGEAKGGRIVDFEWVTAPITAEATGVEIKFSMSPARAMQLGEEDTDEIPDDWLLQVHGQMAVMGWQQVDVAVLLYGRLRIFAVPRNEDLIGIVESAAREMHERIRNDDPPEPDWTHPQTPTLIKALYGVREGVAVELPQESEALWTAYQGLGAEVKRLEAERESIKARVLAAMGESEIGTLSGIGLELVRQQVERKEHVVKACTFTTLRQRKLRI